MRLLLFFFLLPIADALTVGVSPPSVDLGNVLPRQACPVALTVFNPGPEAQSFVVDGLKEKKTVRVKARGKAAVEAEVIAPSVEGMHVLNVTIAPKEGEQGLTPGISVMVKMTVADHATPGGGSTAQGLMPAGASVLAWQEQENEPDKAVGGMIIGGIVGPGLFFYRMVRRWRKPGHQTPRKASASRR